MRCATKRSVVLLCLVLFLLQAACARRNSPLPEKDESASEPITAAEPAWNDTAYIQSAETEPAFVPESVPAPKPDEPDIVEFSEPDTAESATGTSDASAAETSAESAPAFEPAAKSAEEEKAGAEPAPEEEEAIEAVPLEPLQPIAPEMPEEPAEETFDLTEPDFGAPQGPTIETTEQGLTYVNGILIVNKTYTCPREYAPGVDPTAYAAFEAMRDAAAQDGITLQIISGFRSYDHQAGTYQRFCSRDGQAAADRYSARPGHSEHQTGLCFDLNSLLFSFGETPEGQWIAAHCSEYGFIIRYPIDGESSTGYRYEPWHIRYLGVETAQRVTATGLTLEDYLGITSVYAD